MARTRGRLRSVLVALAVVAGTAAVMLTGVTPAQAAVPDRFGFVLWNGAAVVPSATVPAATTVLFAPPGHYRDVLRVRRSIETAMMTRMPVIRIW